MSTAKAVSWLTLMAGLALLATAGLRDELSVHLILIVPVLTGSGPLAVLGMLAVMGGLVGLFMSQLRPDDPIHRAARRDPRDHGHEPDPAEPDGQAAGETEHGGLILIGPIPIAWGSGKQALGTAVAVGVVLTLLALGLWLWTTGRL